MNIEDLKRLSTEELNDLKTDRVIGWYQWVMAQPDMYPDFEEWLQANARTADDESASAYLDELEGGTADGLYIPDESTAVMDQVSDYKKVIAALQAQE